MKLMELLERQDKATKIGLGCKYLHTDGVNILNDNDSIINVPFSDLVYDGWYKYEEFEQNFEFKDGQECFYITGGGEIASSKYCDSGFDGIYIDNFNQFPDKEFAEYIAKRQLLERKLMVFSYLNNATDTEWYDRSKNKYYISSNIRYDELNIVQPSCNSVVYSKFFGRIYFKSREIVDKALELYGKEIEEVMKLSLKFGF